ncbi:uncharacterized protein LOC131679907 [Topomyia yanbarensis]|uniref:uncharacterized protein LOC131679907 n=1 Tax=Topomyia yanbarensis TaxID=2498891 RepID=UPI00273AB800|nr:uncharacterized protein LOC131679907 [Topomyia yanbarensis]
MEDARPLPQFRCDEIDKQKLFKAWKSWKGALECYFDAYGIDDQEQKRAKLLHLGGPQLQRVFQNLPDRESFPLVSLEKRWYDVAINALDAFFQPYRQDCLERYRLRQIKQKEGERFVDFILRLRQQLSDCGFDKYPEDVKDVLTEIFMIDTVIEGCYSQELRRRILQQDKSLAEIESLGVALEGVDQQVKDFGGRIKSAEMDQQTFRIDSDQVSFRKKNYNQPTGFKRKFIARDEVKCFNCARRDHISTSETCPARGKVCHACKNVGHFESCCRSRKGYRASMTTKKVRTVAESVPISENASDEISMKTYYTFHTGNETNMIRCVVGGVKLDLLVDSGSDVNLIPDNVWGYLKHGKVVVQQCVKGSKRILKGYANDNPLTTLGVFTTNVEVGHKIVRAEFYVVAGGQRSILGDKTSKELGILRVGLQINQVASPVLPFPKIKDVQVQIHTDPEIKPVFQPVRRVPIPLEAAVDKKLERLLATDIIEVKRGPASWVSPLVVVGKKNGEPIICLDLRRVNQAVLRERHPMPIVSGTVGKRLDLEQA